MTEEGWTPLISLALGRLLRITSRLNDFRATMPGAHSARLPCPLGSSPLRHRSCSSLPASGSHAGTAADLTVPPVTGSPAQASSKAAAPTDNPPAAVAKALANRRESATLEEAQKLAAMKDGELTKSQKAQKEKAVEAVKLREFVQDDRHFSLVRCVPVQVFGELLRYLLNSKWKLM